MPSTNHNSKKPIGIYLHIPFCECKCRYCDFYSTTDLLRIPDYLKALKKEMALVADQSVRADTLYIGGGTPSLLKPRQIGNIVDHAAHCFNLEPTAEMTLEVNPATTTVSHLRDYAAFGFSRVNIGIQSFSDKNLHFLNRSHTAEQGMAAVKTAQDAGFNNIGLDIIYGLPNQTPGSWKADLMQAISLSPKHIAAYMLTYEPHTPLFADKQSGQVVPLSDLRVAELFRIIHNFLCAAGFEHYEISNFAQSPRWRSKHNQKYWTFAPYIGLGPAAHSCRIPERWWNHRSLNTYLQMLDQDLLPRDELEHLSENQQIIETLYLSLRQSDGIGLKDFQNRFHIDFKLFFHTALDKFAAEDWIDLDEHRCSLTPEGMLFLDRIVDELVEML